ncbi:MAG: CheR family methyltransferase, partial [Myxococcota bacterium]
MPIQSTPPGTNQLWSCRNVMIYFDDRVRQALVSEFRRMLRPGGLLVVGMSEGLVGCEDGFRR